MAQAKRIAFAPEARQEAKQARQWYEKQQPGLGRQFMQEVRAAVERIRQSPLMYPPVQKSYRQVIVRRFPYALYYEYVPPIATVYTVFHCSQDPAKLDERLP